MICFHGLKVQSGLAIIVSTIFWKFFSGKSAGWAKGEIDDSKRDRNEDNQTICGQRGIKGERWRDANEISGKEWGEGQKTQEEETGKDHANNDSFDTNNAPFVDSTLFAANLFKVSPIIPIERTWTRTTGAATAACGMETRTAERAPALMAREAWRKSKLLILEIKEVQSKINLILIFFFHQPLRCRQFSEQLFILVYSHPLISGRLAQLVRAWV